MNDLIDVVIFENPAKDIQYRFSISEFRGVTYLSIREWYKDFEGHFAPSNNGITVPYLLHTCSGLFNAFVTTLSKAEVLTEVAYSNEYVTMLQEQAELYAKVSKLIGAGPYYIDHIDGDPTTGGSVQITCQPSKT